VNIICGYIIGRCGLFGIEQSGCLVSDIGCGIVLFSFVLLTLVEGGHDEQGQAEQRARIPTYIETVALPSGGKTRGSQDGGNVYLRPPFCVQGAWSPGTDGEPEPVHLETPQHSMTDPGPTTSSFLHSLQASTSRNAGLKLVGAVLAIVTGVLTGTCAAPATLYNLEHPGRPAAAVFPMSLGIWIMATVIYIFYAFYAKLQRLPVRHAPIWPSFIAGALWSIGNAATLLGVTQISYTIAYSTAVIGSLWLAGVYSIVIFREITQLRQIVIFSVGLASQAVGVVMIAIGTEGSG